MKIINIINGIKNKKFKYKDEVIEEFKNNSIVLSFSISIIIIGIISIFFKTNHTLLIGIAISSLLLSIIQCFNNGNTILNILPIFTLLIFGFFESSIDKIPVINILLKDEYCNIIIFLAISFTFITMSIKNIKYKFMLKKQLIDYNLDKNKMIYSELEIIRNVSEKTLKIKKTAEEKGLYDLAFNKVLDDLKVYVEDETFISNVKSSLIIKGSEEKKATFSVEEIEESIIMNSGLSRVRSCNNFDNDDYSEVKE